MSEASLEEIIEHVLEKVQRALDEARVRFDLNDSDVVYVVTNVVAAIIEEAEEG